MAQPNPRGVRNPASPGLLRAAVLRQRRSLRVPRHSSAPCTGGLAGAGCDPRCHRPGCDLRLLQHVGVHKRTWNLRSPPPPLPERHDMAVSWGEGGAGCGDGGGSAGRGQHPPGAARSLLQRDCGPGGRAVLRGGGSAPALCPPLPPPPPHAAVS